MVYSRVDSLTGCMFVVTLLQIERLTGHKRRCPTADDIEAKRAKIAELKRAVQDKEAALVSRKERKVGHSVVTLALPSALHQWLGRPRTATKVPVVFGCAGRQTTTWRKGCSVTSMDSMG